MDDGSEGRFWMKLRSLFGKNDAPLEEHIQEARQDGEIKSEDVSMLLNVLDLDETTVDDVMTPRADIVCAEASSSLQDVAEIIIEHGHSRIPIYEENRDHMVGVIHAKDLMGALLHPDGMTHAARELMRPTFFVPETADIKSVLRTLRTEGVHLAIVVDEYGGTSGLVTLEDILEEIVGDIEDEYDADRPDDIVPQEDGSLLASGKTWLEELQECCGITINSEQVDTLGGYLSQLAGRIPAQGESFEIQGRRFVVEEADAKHVRTVRILPAGNGVKGS
ncbi:MAG: hemolysin family protein [Desulfovibrionaceae bacterium]